jgi:hypothetical protein
MLFSCTDSRSKEIKSQKMDDPIMGMTYETDKVKFDSCPRSLDSREGAAKGYQWIYAECARPSDTLYIVSCLMKSWNDRSGKWIDSILEPDFGAVIKLSNGKSKAIGTPDGLYGRHAVLPAADADCLMRDAAARYIQAFGGASELQKSVTSNKISANVLPTAFVEKLKAEGVIIPSSKGK